MAKLRQCALMDEFKATNKESTAETLIRLLREDKDAHHVSCTRSCDRAKNLVRIKKKRKKDNYNDEISSV